MCPGLPSGNKFAPTCYFDNSIDGVRCSCEEGYIGHRCESCAINYYGNPLENGGSCKLCQCNGNVDINDRSSCDERTGKCEKCLYNTAGDHCDICKAGFYGNASNHDCKRNENKKQKFIFYLILKLMTEFQKHVIVNHLALKITQP